MDHHAHGHASETTRDIDESGEYMSGVLSYYWPGATYVHCARSSKSNASQCLPLRIAAEAYKGRLPEEHWKGYVDGDGFVTIPCGEAVECKVPGPAEEPFGPLAINGSDYLAFQTGYVEWHPPMYTECRSSGVYAHVLLMMLACVVMLPLGYAALCRGADQTRTSSTTQVAWVKKAFGWLRLGGIALATTSSLIVSIQQSAMRSKLQCLGSGIVSQHGIMGWFCLAALACEMVLHRALSSKGRLVGVMKVAKRFAETVSRVFAILPWALKGFVGYTMSFQTTKYTVLVALTLGCILSGVWQSCGCYEYSHFISQEFGHMTYAILWISLATVSMNYNHPKLRLQLTQNEGVDLMFGGMLSVCVVTLGTGGGIFYSGRSMSNQLVDSEQFMKDLQHTTQAGIWAVAGFLDVVLARVGIASGLPFLLASLCHGSMVLLHGHQTNELAMLGHVLHAYAMILTGILRFFWRTHEAAFFLTLTSLLFVSSSKCMASWAFANNFDPISYYLSVAIICALLWGWLVYVTTDKSKAMQAGENSGENSFYAAQELQNRCNLQTVSPDSALLGCYNKARHEHSIKMSM